MLSEHIGAVRNASPRYQVDLYERLLETVDAYAMDIRALLLKAPAFKLGDSGEVVVEPRGILRACENRRRNVKEILSRLLDPLAVPVTEEAAVFWLTDSFDQRKMLVHRREHSVLEQRDRIHQPAPKRQTDNSGRSVSKARNVNAPHLKPLDHLPPDTRKMFDSIWDLDRILGYLMTEYLYPDAGGAAESVRQAAVMELERFRARGEGASLMPLHDALGALKAALRKTHHAAGSSLEAPAVAQLLNEIEQLIEAQDRKMAPSQRSTTVGRCGAQSARSGLCCNRFGQRLLRSAKGARVELLRQSMSSPLRSDFTR